MPRAYNVRTTNLTTGDVGQTGRGRGETATGTIQKQVI